MNAEQDRLCLLEIVGEAASSLSDRFKGQHGEIAWSQIMATRHGNTVFGRSFYE